MNKTATPQAVRASKKSGKRSKVVTRSKLERLKYHHISVDLGTSNTLLSVEGKGIICDQPSVVATNKTTKKVVAMGQSAANMIGRSPQGIEASKPINGGVVSDFESVEHMLKSLVSNVHSSNKVLSQRPVMILSLPCGISEVEQRAVVEAARSCGARKAYLIDEPVAAALGAGIDIFQEKASMIVDIGGGTTDIAVLANGQTLVTKSIRHGSNDITNAIRQFVREEYSLQLGDRTAEEVKISLASLAPKAKNRKLVVRGRNTVSGLPQELELSSEMIRGVLSKNLRQIAEAIKSLLDEAPTEVIADILDKGIYLSGGGALISGIDHFLRSETHMTINITSNPLSAVVEGGMVALSKPKKYKKVLTLVP